MSKGDTPFDVRLGIEETLDVTDVVPFGAPETGVRQFEEIALGVQDLHARVIQVQEILKTGEVVSLTDGVDAPERQRNSVALRKVPHHLRLQGPLDVNVKLGFRQTLDEIRIVRHASLRSRLPGRHRLGRELALLPGTYPGHGRIEEPFVVAPHYLCPRVGAEAFPERLIYLVRPGIRLPV